MTSAAVVSFSAVAPPVGDRAGAGRRDGAEAGTRAGAAVIPFRPRVAARCAGATVDLAAPRIQHAATRGPSGSVDDIDHALVRAVARGSKSAMRTLFTRHQTRVYRIIKRIVGDHAEAEDLTSEVFLAVWRRADLFQGRSRVSTWLCGIARHKALTSLQTVPPTCHDDDVMLTVCDPAPGPEGELHAKERMTALRRALATLSREHRQIIDLVYYRGKSIKEIADMLGIRLNTVKTRMFYARKRLAALMEAAGV